MGSRAREAGYQSIRSGGIFEQGREEKIPPYGWDLHMCGVILSGERLRRPYGL